MNQRISLYTRATTLNAYGEKSNAYTLAGSVWGSVKHSTGEESLVSFKNKPVSVIHITARNFSGTTGDEIEYNGYRWEIEGVRRRHRQNNIIIIANRLHLA